MPPVNRQVRPDHKGRGWEVNVKLNPKDTIEVVPEVVDLVTTIAGALKKDDDGKVRLTRDELKDLGKAATRLGTAVALMMLRHP